MNTLRRLRNFWMPWVAMIVLGCFSDAVAQTSYKVIDLGVVNDKDNFSCAMDLNNFGWTLSQEGVMDPVSLNAGATVLPGQSVINIGEFKIDLGTLGGPNSSTTSRKPWVRPKRRFLTRTAKTFAALAHTLPVARFFGNSAT